MSWDVPGRLRAGTLSAEGGEMERFCRTWRYERWGRLVVDCDEAMAVFEEKRSRSETYEDDEYVDGEA